MFELITFAVVIQNQIMEAQIKRIQKISKKKEIKTEITCFKLTKSRKKQLTAIRNTYGRSYGVIINSVIEQVYKGMLKDEFTKLLNDAKQLDAISEECLLVIKISNPEVRKLIQNLIDYLEDSKSKLDNEQSKLVEARSVLLEQSKVFIESSNLLVEQCNLLIGELNRFKELSISEQKSQSSRLVKSVQTVFKKIKLYSKEIETEIQNKELELAI